MSRNKNDAYYTPPALTRVLLKRLHADYWRNTVVDDEEEGTRRKRLIAEPCAGDNWIDRELRAKGYQTVTGDIDPSKPVHYAGIDFFSKKAGRIYKGVDGIITNPPFSAAPRFVRRALEITPNVAVLLRLTFLEPCESRPESARADLLRKLARVIVLPRVSFYQGKSGTDSATCAWFIWREHRYGSTNLEIVTEAELAEAAGQQKLFGGEA